MKDVLSWLWNVGIYYGFSFQCAWRYFHTKDSFQSSVWLGLWIAIGAIAGLMSKQWYAGRAK